MRLLRFLSAVPFVLCAAAAQNAPYHLVKQVTIGAPDRWDYVSYEPAQDRVFIAHGDRVTVVDNKTAEVIGAVEGMPGGTHGITFADGKGYTDDGRAGVAVVFDLKTLKPIKTI